MPVNDLTGVKPPVKVGVKVKLKPSDFHEPEILDDERYYQEAFKHDVQKEIRTAGQSTKVIEKNGTSKVR